MACHFVDVVAIRSGLTSAIEYMSERTLQSPGDDGALLCTPQHTCSALPRRLHTGCSAGMNAPADFENWQQRLDMDAQALPKQQATEVHTANATVDQSTATVVSRYTAPPAGLSNRLADSWTAQAGRLVSQLP